MAETLADLGLTEFDDTRKENFLTMMHASQSTETAALLIGVPVPVVFPTLPPGSSAALADNFYTPGMPVSEHEEAYPDFHKIVFGMMDGFGSALNAPAAKSLAPIVFDPTEPILQIINAIEIPGLDEAWIIENLETFMAKASEIIDAVTKFPDDPDLLVDVLIEIKPDLGSLDPSLGELLDGFSFDLGGSALPEIPVPALPNTDIPVIMLAPIGLGWVFTSFLNIVIDAIAQVIQFIANAVNDLIRAIAAGLVALLEFLIELIMLVIIEPLLAILGALSGITGFMSLITTVIVFVIGMMVLTIVGILIGTGLIAKALQNLLGL